jgi:hypothetical protein
MTLARWQATIQDEAGNVLPGATVEVRREVSGAPLAVLYSDRDGATPLGNPFAADGDGFAAFHVVGGAYRITATSGADSRTWRYVAVGRSAESDTLTTGISFAFDDATADSDPGPGVLRLNNAVLASVTQIYIDDLSSFAVDVSAWLDTLDDGGSAPDRGTLVLAAADASGFAVFRVTGSVTDATGYKKISVTHLSSGGAFALDALITVQFTRAGVDGTDGADGTGTVNGPLNQSPGIQAGELAAFSDATGTKIDGSGKTISTVGTGKQSIWIDAGGMIRQTTNPPSTLTDAELATNDIMQSYLGFDTTTAENAQFRFAAPKGMNEAAGVTFKVFWSHGSTVTNFGVAWQLQGLGLSNDDAMDAAPATGIVVTDTGGTTDDLYITDESVPVTIAGVAEGDLCYFRISRQPANAADTLAVDARLIGVLVLYQTNTNTDD